MARLHASCLTDRPFREWLDELAMAVVEGRTDEALGLLHDRFPDEMPSIQVARLLSAGRRMRGAGMTGDVA